MVYSADNYKNQEIRDMYYIIYNNRLREGVEEKLAKVHHLESEHPIHDEKKY